MKAKFLLVLVAVVILIGYVAWRSENVPPVLTDPTGGRDMQSAGGITLTEEEKKTCGITAAVTEGPYYVSGAPALANGNLNYTNLPGDPLTVSGYVYEGTDRTRPLAGAIVDIWQADTAGSYHPNANGPISQYTQDQIALRGYVTTDANGYYSFTTVYPGAYSGRTRHIHVKVRVEGFDELTSQLIVPSREGDEISFDEDTISRGLPECHLLEIDSTLAPATSSFDFYLER